MKENIKVGILNGAVTMFVPTIRGLVAGFEISDRIYRNPRRNQKLGKIITVGSVAVGTVGGLLINSVALPILIPVGIYQGVKSARKK